MVLAYNLQRESLLPSERAFAYKMKLDAMKHQGERVDLTSSQVGTKLRADEILAQQAGSSRNQVQRYIRLTELIPELMDMVDEKKIALKIVLDNRHRKLIVVGLLLSSPVQFVPTHVKEPFSFNTS